HAEHRGQHRAHEVLGDQALRAGRGPGRYRHLGPAVAHRDIDAVVIRLETAPDLLQAWLVNAHFRPPSALATRPRGPSGRTRAPSRTGGRPSTSRRWPRPRPGSGYPWPTAASGTGYRPAPGRSPGRPPFPPRPGRRGRAPRARTATAARRPGSTRTGRTAGRARG